MSGILAVLRTDGAPVEPAVVRRMIDSMSLRGPDRQATWCDGQVGLGHTLLRTTHESAREQQPFSLDGRVVIVADGRVDAREELIPLLSDAAPVSTSACDVELILRAYLKWGDACVEHLLGDFAFAIWDGPRRRLFCARDHMGVKPFYYAHVGRWLLVSSTIDALRLHPEVSSELNDLAIADFLMFGFNQDAGTTSFRDIQRLAPAHTLTSEGGGLSTSRYWTLPMEEPVYYRRDEEYVERFRGLVRQAVKDRLRTDRVGVLMSGGLDSPMLAATARDILGDRHAHDPVRAFTFVYDRLFADPERKHAGLVAAHLQIPIHFYALDERSGWVPSAAASCPEPCLAVTDTAPEAQCFAEMSSHSRVGFYGEGPDNALGYEWKPHLRYLVKRRQFVRLVSDIGKHILRHRRIPLLPTLPRMLRERRVDSQAICTIPDWLSPDLVQRLDLNDRWQVWFNGKSSAHPSRPRTHASLLTSQWQSTFETREPEYSGAMLEMRHPYVDIRLLGFMLRTPAMPWCRAKYLMRAALRGAVPEQTRKRPKEPLAGDPRVEQCRRDGLPQTASSPLMARYVPQTRSTSVNQNSAWSVYQGLLLVALSYWLSGEHSKRLAA